MLLKISEDLSTLSEGSSSPWWQLIRHLIVNNNVFHEPAETQLNDDDALDWPNFVYVHENKKIKFWWSLQIDKV